MWRPEVLSKDRLIGAAVFLGAILIFLSDMTPIRGSADGAAYALVIATAAYLGQRWVFRAALLSSVLTVLAPLLGAENDETFLQIIAGRLMGLGVIGAVTGILAHLSSISAAATASNQEIARFNTAMLKIARQALFLEKPLRERFQTITEMTTEAIGVDRASVARIESLDDFTVYDSWDCRLGVHLRERKVPAACAADFCMRMQNDFIAYSHDIETMVLDPVSHDYYRRINIRAVLHTASLCRENAMGALIISHGRPHHWTEREIAFAKSIAHMVALLFATEQAERTLEHLDFVNEALMVLGKSGHVEYANRAARALAKEAGPPSMPFSLPPMTEASDQVALSHGGRDLEVHRTRTPDGEMLIRIDDVTERNAAQAEAKRMVERLEQSAKLQSMGELAGGVAHDFSNILAAIMGFTQALQKRLEQLPIEHSITGRILGVCEKARSLTEEILTFARTSSAQREPLDLAQILADSRDLIPDLAERSANLVIEPVTDSLPVLGNAVQLMQLIQNLVVNAHHASEGVDGPITVSAGRASGRELRLLERRSADSERLMGTFGPGEYCYLRVADCGQGIAPEILDRIFEPFFTTKKRRQGSGLGLAVVHRVVETHGGCCHVHSEVGKGTVFTIYLPLLDELTEDLTLSNGAFAAEDARRQAGARPG